MKTLYLLMTHPPAGLCRTLLNAAGLCRLAALVLLSLALAGCATAGPVPCEVQGRQPAKWQGCPCLFCACFKGKTCPCPAGECQCVWHDGKPCVRCPGTLENPAAAVVGFAAHARCRCDAPCCRKR